METKFVPHMFFLAPKILGVIGQKHKNLHRMKYEGVRIYREKDTRHFNALVIFRSEDDKDDEVHIRYFSSSQSFYFNCRMMTFNQGTYIVFSNNGYSYYQLDKNGVSQKKLSEILIKIEDEI
jgi:hypothetical protein